MCSTFTSQAGFRLIECLADAVFRGNIMNQGGEQYERARLPDSQSVPGSPPAHRFDVSTINKLTPPLTVADHFMTVCAKRNLVPLAGRMTPSGKE